MLGPSFDLSLEKINVFFGKLINVHIFARIRFWKCQRLLFLFFVVLGDRTENSDRGLMDCANKTILLSCMVADDSCIYR